MKKIDKKKNDIRVNSLKSVHYLEPRITPSTPEIISWI